MSSVFPRHAPDKRSASPTEMLVSPKRQKTRESFLPSTLQRSELDSALALASLALDSPKKSVVDQKREADISPKVTDEELRSDPAPVTPASPANQRKRVHFSAEVPEASVTFTGATASRYIRRRRPMVVPPQRPMSHPPYNPAHHFRPPMGVPPPPHPGYRHHMMHRPWIPHHQARHVPPPPRHVPPPPRHVALPPRHVPPPPHFPMVAPSANTWICDYCNSAAFSTYHDACVHEDDCKRRTGGGHMSLHQQSRQPEEKKEAADEENVRDECTPTWSSGCVALAVEPADTEWLSELNCYFRKNCIEAFSATDEDVLKTSKRGRIVRGQVGIRCKLCAHRPLQDKAVAAVSYPTSMAGIYESVKRWQRVHLPACLDVGDDTQATLDQLQHDSVWVPTTRQYWTDSARAIGMVDTADGIRFEREPAASTNWMPDATKPTTNDDDESAMDQQQPGGFICLQEDEEFIPPYVYFLMRQVEPCYFTEADRFVARSKGPVGFAGFQCRHCQGHAGLGKYFPLTSKALSTNSTSQNIHAHMLKCRKSTQSVKDELINLKTEKIKSPRLIPGWRKTFFERLWERMHGDRRST